jgi:hypothetical protein
MLARHRENVVGFAAGMSVVASACATGQEIPRSDGGSPGATGVTGSGGAAGNGDTAAPSGGATGMGVEMGGREAGGSGGTAGSAAASGGSAGTPARMGSGGGPSGSGGAPNDDDSGAGTMASGGNLATGGHASTGGSSGAGTGGAATNQILFSDDFEGSAKSWISVPSDGWSIVSDDTKVFRQGTLDNQFRISSAGDVAWTDQAVEARVKVLAFTGSSTSYLAGVFARFKDLDNHYFVALQSDGHLKIKKKVGGSSTSVSSQADATIAAGTWYTVKFTVKGSTLTADLDGKQVLTVNDSDIPSGGFAVGTKNATAEFDDVKVTTP